MAKAKTKAEPKVVENANVLIMVGNVWMRDAKFRQFDVVELSVEEAKFLVGRKQAKITGDAPTVVGINEDGKAGRRVL